MHRSVVAVARLGDEGEFVLAGDMPGMPTAAVGAGELRFSRGKFMKDHAREIVSPVLARAVRARELEQRRRAVHNDHALVVNFVAWDVEAPLADVELERRKFRDGIDEPLRLVLPLSSVDRASEGFGAASHAPRSSAAFVAAPPWRRAPPLR